MQKISSITATATPDGLFTNGSVATGVSPTNLEAEWFNTVQDELVHVVQGAGLSLDPENNSQLLAALKKLSTSYYVDSGVANAIVINPVPALTALADGQVFDIACAAANTGSVTLKVNALNAYPVWGMVGALQGGEISAAKGVIRVIWSATNNAFLLVSINAGGALPVGLATQNNHSVPLGQLNNLFITHGAANVFTTIDIAGQRRLMEGTATGYFNGGLYVFNLPLSFANVGYTLIATDTGIGVYNLAASPSSKSQVQLWGKDGGGNLVTGNIGFKYIAVGPAA